MARHIDAHALKARLSQPREIAFIDVREYGEYGEGHPFFAVSLPYSRFEIGLPSLVPNPAVELVLCDGGDGVAQRAAQRAQSLGYENVCLLAGGSPAWARAGFTLYSGVNVPSKAFGELVELARGTPHVSARELKAMQERGEKVLVVDGRPLAEFRTMNIPGGVCCPNGELALRIDDLAPDAATTIVVNCAGRTRSIIGAQTLIDLGIPNRVYALENGTQGWFLAGFSLETGAERGYPDLPCGELAQRRARARSFAVRHGVACVSPDAARRWAGEQTRTTYLIDVRSAEEVGARPLQGFVHAPGGQLLQATDHWIGVRGARLVLVDAEDVRAPVVAAWLRQLGHDAVVLKGGIDAAARLAWPARRASVARLPTIGADELATALRTRPVDLIDLRPGVRYRQGHIAEALWSIRPRLCAAVSAGSALIVLVADDPALAALAAVDLGELGRCDIRWLADPHAAWAAAGLTLTATPARPADGEMIDFLFFAAQRHHGNAEAARQYLAWEVGLIGQLDGQERSAFTIPGAGRATPM